MEVRAGGGAEAMVGQARVDVRWDREVWARSRGQDSRSFVSWPNRCGIRKAQRRAIRV